MFFRNTTYANTDTQSIQYNAILQSYFNIPDALPPDCFIQPTTTHEISTIISILSHSQYQLAVKAGGHMLYVGSNAIVHGVTIDLRRMRRTTLSADKKTASVEPGAKWGEVYQTLDSLGYAIPGGRASDVGVAGLTLGGGNSFFAARYGFVCDNVQNFEIVLGNGSVTNGNADENPDLFKALKGGSGKLGLVTRFDFVAFPSGPLWGGVAIYDFDDIHKSFEPFVDFTNNISEDPYGSLVTFYTHNSTTNQTLASNLHEYTGNATGHPYYSSSDSPDATSIAFFHLRQNRQTHYKYPPRGLAATTEVFAEVNAIITRLLEATYAHPPYFLAQALFQPLPRLFTDHSLQRGGGNILGLDREHDNSILLSFIVIWTDPSKDDEVRRLSDAVLGNVTAYTKSVGAYRPWQYVNYAFEDQDLIGSYGDANVEFLRRVSGKYDPRQTFQRLVPGGWKLGMRAGGRRSLISTNSRVLRRCA